MSKNPELDNTKATSVKSEHTKLKVAVGYLLLIIIVFSLVFITYKNFHNIVSSVESLSSARNESPVIKSIASGINEIRTTSTIYSITFKPADYTIYHEKAEYVSDLIDSLDLQLTQKKAYGKSDSLNTVFNAYIVSIRDWLKLKKADRTDDLRKITEIIEDQGDSLARSIFDIPHATTVTVRKLTEKPVGKDSVVALDAKKDNLNKTFFQRIFGSRKRNKETQPSSSNVVNQQITTETYTDVDTGYYNQVNIILSNIKDTLSRTESIKKIRKAQLARLEMLLLNYQSALITEINSLLRNIEEGDRAVLNSRIMASKQTARNASKILFFGELTILIISLVFMYVIFTDLTKSNYYKQMLELEKSETEKLAKVKEDFLAMMSHEIRTPLTKIIGFSEQLENTSLKSDQQQQVHSIVNSSEHLLALVNDILDYSKIESGSLSFENIGFCINDVMADAMEILRIEPAKKELQLIYQPLADGGEKLLSGDPVRLKQVMINLISNSIKFTETGFIKIETSILEYNQGYSLQCHVKDTGIGIEKDRLETIFTNFSQADNSITRKYGGTGLGLSICRKLIEMQNGSISVTSVPGQGSDFSFEIPYAKASRNEYSLKKNVTYEQGNKLRNKKLLVIDDDLMIPMLLEPIFQSWHINYTFCSKSTQAWNILQETEFDLIMLDIQMLDLDGYELQKLIRTEKSSKNIMAKIVICTANVLFDTNKSTSLSHDIPVLFKPFKKVELWNILCKTLDIGDPEEYDPVSDNSATISGSYSLKNLRTFANEEKGTLVLFINTFVSQTRKELSEMQHCYIQKNYKQVREISHKLKNTFGQLEANELLANLISLESLTAENRVDSKKIEEQIDSLNQGCQKLFVLLEKEVH